MRKWKNKQKKKYKKFSSVQKFEIHFTQKRNAQKKNFNRIIKNREKIYETSLHTKRKNLEKHLKREKIYISTKIYKKKMKKATQKQEEKKHIYIFNIL